MPGSIATREQGTYTEVWTSVPAYRKYSPGVQYRDLFRALKEQHAPNSTLLVDFGCGTGEMLAPLADEGCSLTLVDITAGGLPATLPPRTRFVEACLWDSRAMSRVYGHVGACCDVLEHLPTAFVSLAVSEMLHACSDGLFLSVATRPDMLGLWVGKALHQTVQPFVWWRDLLRELGEVQEARDLLKDAVFWVRKW